MLTLKEDLMVSEKLEKYLKDNAGLFRMSSVRSGINPFCGDIVKTASNLAVHDTIKNFNRNKGVRFSNVIPFYFKKYAEKLKKESLFMPAKAKAGKTGKGGDQGPVRREGDPCGCGCKGFTSDFLGYDVCVACGAKYKTGQPPKMVFLDGGGCEEYNELHNAISDDDIDIPDSTGERDFFSLFEAVITEALIGRVSPTIYDFISLVFSDIDTGDKTKEELICFLFGKKNFSHLVSMALADIKRSGLQAFGVEVLKESGEDSMIIVWEETKEKAIAKACRYGKVLDVISTKM